MDYCSAMVTFPLGVYLSSWATKKMVAVTSLAVSLLQENSMKPEQCLNIGVFVPRTSLSRIRGIHNTMDAAHWPGQVQAPHRLGYLLVLCKVAIPLVKQMSRVLLLVVVPLSSPFPLSVLQPVC